MSGQPKTGAIVIGSGNFSTDLMFKIARLSKRRELVADVALDIAASGAVNA